MSDLVKPPSAFHRVAVAVCSACGFTNFASCPVHYQLLSRADGPRHYACSVRGCKTTTKSTTYKCNLCNRDDWDWLAVLILQSEVQYAFNAFKSHPRAASTGQLAHGLIICALCQTTNFPGTEGRLTECRGGLLYNYQGGECDVANWSRTHVHVSGCEGVENIHVLTVHPVMLTLQQLEFLNSRIKSSPTGLWSDSPVRSTNPFDDEFDAPIDDAQVDELMSNAITQLDMTSRLSKLGTPPSSSRPVPPPRYQRRNSKSTTKADVASSSSATNSERKGNVLCVSGECTICFDEKEFVVFYKCGHMIACLECATNLCKAKKGCPICRADITEVIRVFLG